MPINENVNTSVADEATSTMNRRQPAWVSRFLALPTTDSKTWPADWIHSLQKALKESNSSVVIETYQALNEGINNLFNQACPSDETKRHQWVDAVCKQLIVLHVYINTAEEYHPYQLPDLQLTIWEKQASCLIEKLPTATHLSELGFFTDRLSKNKPIDTHLDKALLKLHEHSVVHYFNQMTKGIKESAQDILFACDKETLFYGYINSIDHLNHYLTHVSSLSFNEKKHLSTLLVNQIKDLIKEVGKLSLPSSWMDHLKEWIRVFFRKLILLDGGSHKNESLPAQLLVMSDKLRKAAKISSKNQTNESLNVIRERCWFYFSLHEELMRHWDAKENKHAARYEKNAKSLFKSLMRTFGNPEGFEKGIFSMNPLKKSLGSRIASTLKTTLFHQEDNILPLQACDLSIDTALEKIADFFKEDFDRTASLSLVAWLMNRHQPELMAKLDEFSSTKTYQDEKNLPNINIFEQYNLCDLVKESYDAFRTDLNQITQLILSVWFKEIGITVSRSDLNNLLKKEGRWLSGANQKLVKGASENIYILSDLLLRGIERSGAGIYVFPKLLELWKSFKKSLADHNKANGASLDDLYSHKINPMEFVHAERDKIIQILNKIHLIFHPDRFHGLYRNDTDVMEKGRYIIKKINSIKRKLEKISQVAPSELANKFSPSEGGFVLRDIDWLVNESTGSFLTLVRYQLIYVMHRDNPKLKNDRMIYKSQLIDIAEKDAALTETTAALTETAAALTETAAALTEKDEMIAEKDALIAQLKAALRAAQGQPLSQSTSTIPLQNDLNIAQATRVIPDISPLDNTEDKHLAFNQNNSSTLFSLVSREKATSRQTLAASPLFNENPGTSSGNVFDLIKSSANNAQKEKRVDSSLGGQSATVGENRNSLFCVSPDVNSQSVDKRLREAVSTLESLKRS